MNILITGAWQDAVAHISDIESMGHKVCFQQFEHEKLKCTYEWVEGVICNGLFLHHEIEKFANLQYIQLTSTGYDRVPVDYIKSHNIVLYNAKGVYSIPIAEYAITAILYLYKQIDFFRDNQKESLWKKNRNLLELYGKKVCIIGCGSVGRECAKRLQAFGCHVIGIVRRKKELLNFEELYMMEELPDIIGKQDVVILTLPLTKETYHVIDANLLKKMKDTSIIVNLSRGYIVDSEALICELKLKRISAVLDVFDEEPLPFDSELWNLDNVLLSPHNSFVGDNNKERLETCILSNLHAFCEI